MFRQAKCGLELLLVHPGGPFFARKDDGAWTIPKGEASAGEDLLTRAKIEFAEELGLPAGEELFSLGEIKQKGGKTVHAWAFAGDLPHDFVLHSNTFELRWPRGGKSQVFPEIDRAEFFSEPIARQKINPAQLPFLDRLRAILSGRNSLVTPEEAALVHRPSASHG
jgi:predicted NUDIX family NTP pyrophosphohydrolase